MDNQKLLVEENKLRAYQSSLQMLKADNERVKTVIERFDAEILKTKDEKLIEGLKLKTQPFKDRLNALVDQIALAEARVEKQIEAIAALKAPPKEEAKPDAAT